MNAAIIGVSPLTNCVTTNAFGFLNIVDIALLKASCIKYARSELTTTN